MLILYHLGSNRNLSLTVYFQLGNVSVEQLQLRIESGDVRNKWGPFFSPAPLQTFSSLQP